jgi:YjbE family integral membrane protein
VWDLFGGDQLAPLATVIVIDIVMSGDNAMIIAMAAAGLPPGVRRRAICIGVVVATVLRVLFAVLTFQLLAIIGLTLAGGLLLLWVCWRMWRDIRSGRMRAANPTPAAEVVDANPPKRKTLRQALIAIVMADVSMSLDNVLAVAGAARDHLGALVFGLALSIALMAVASNYIARLLERHQWIAYVGLVIVAYVAGSMIYDGLIEVSAAAAAAIGL